MEVELYKMVTNLVKQEELVYQIIQEYLNKNRYLQLNEVIPFIKAKLAKKKININETGIISILSSLVKRNIIVEGSKLLQEDILKVRKRRRIYEYILENPGVFYYDIVKTLNISSHVVRWHLNMLVLFNFVNKIKIENHDIYFDVSISQKKAEAIYYISNDKCRKIIEYLKINDHGITKTQLSKDLSMHLNTISKYLEGLENIRLLIRKKFSKKTLYFLEFNNYNSLIKN